MWPPVDMLTKDGYDLQWGTNVVGHFYFTELLMPALIAGAATSPDHHARVITTSSSGAYGETLHFETFKDGPARRKMTTEKLYYQSKHVGIADISLIFGSSGLVLTITSRRETLSSPGRSRSDTETRASSLFRSTQVPSPCLHCSARRR